MSFKSMMNMAVALELIDAPVYGIPATHSSITEDNEGWINVVEYIEAKFKEYLAKINLAKTVANNHETKALRDNSYGMWPRILENGVKPSKARSTAGKLVSSYGSMNTHEYTMCRIKALCDGFEIKYREVKPDHDLSKIYKDCDKKYPLISNINYNYKPRDLEHYINVCDASPSIQVKEI